MVPDVPPLVVLPTSDSRIGSDDLAVLLSLHGTYRAESTSSLSAMQQTVTWGGAAAVVLLGGALYIAAQDIGSVMIAFLFAVLWVSLSFMVAGYWCAEYGRVLRAVSFCHHIECILLTARKQLTRDVFMEHRLAFGPSWNSREPTYLYLGKQYITIAAGGVLAALVLEVVVPTLATVYWLSRVWHGHGFGKIACVGAALLLLYGLAYLHLRYIALLVYDTHHNCRLMCLPECEFRDTPRRAWSRSFLFVVDIMLFPRLQSRLWERWAWLSRRKVDVEARRRKTPPSR